ncbi:hypothetical protein [Cupriavidus sp. AcVe19-6a]|nr:hypothetical protein [Cupriavidus sp. AcVe19-6a]MBP0639318.1 hypothetical protein [Cupriavidus sp. AcVe19-6a]
MLYRLVLAGLSVAGLVLLFGIQFKLTDTVGRKEDDAAHHFDERRHSAD